MKRSDEIKEIIRQSIQKHDPFALYEEIIAECKEADLANEFRGINHKWSCACHELRKEDELYAKMIDETFFQSIVCYNFTTNIKKKPKQERADYLWMHKKCTGMDAEAVMKGKHCWLAKTLIDSIEQALRLQEEIDNENK